MISRMPHFWRPHLKPVVIALVTVLVPAAIALTHFAGRQLDVHRYELEGALREQYKSNLERLDDGIRGELESLERSIAEDLMRGEAAAPLRAVMYSGKQPHSIYVDLLDERGEPRPLGEALSLPQPGFCEVADYWRELSIAGSLAFDNGRIEEAAGFYKALADAKSPDARCPCGRCPDGKCPPFIHVLGMLGQARSAMLLGDSRRAFTLLKHLVDHHIDDRPPMVGDPPALLDGWYLRSADSRGRLRELVVRGNEDPVRNGHRQALTELAERLGWAPSLEQARACWLWHQTAAKLVRTELKSATRGKFVRFGHPDLVLMGAARTADGFVIYRVEWAKWRAGVDHILGAIPSDTRVELRDARGNVLAGERLPEGHSEFIETRTLAAVPGWNLSLGPADPQRLAAAAERLNLTSFALVALVLVSVAAGLGLLLVNYIKQARLARMQADFVSGVSHELKTPLALLQMSAETLWMGRYRTAEEGRELQGRVVAEVERLNRLVTQVMEFSRLQRKAWEFEFGPTDAESIVRDVLADFEPRLREAGARVEIEPSNIGPVRADPAALRQVLINLLDNALKYCDSPPNIRLRLRARDGKVEITVQDNGVGMTPTVQKRMFEQFFRGDDPAVRRHRGTGLGLAIVQDILAAHGGDIWVESAPGVGSTFTVVLPQWTEAAPAPAELRRPLPEPAP